MKRFVEEQVGKRHFKVDLLQQPAKKKKREENILLVCKFAQDSMTPALRYTA